MRYLFLLFFLISSSVISGQIYDYHQIELNKGSHFIGKIVNKTNKYYWLETNLLDTFYIKRGATRRIFLIQNNDNTKGDIPILTKGIYRTFHFGVGTGSRVTNPHRINTLQSNFLLFSLFNPPDPQLLVRQSTLLTVYKVNFTVGYQMNRHFGLGMGFNVDAFRQGERLNGNVFLERMNLNPYFQGKFNYPIPNWGNKDLWLTVNAFRHTEVITGMSFYSANNVYNIGLGWYRSYFAFKTENYLSLQLGFQF